MLTFVLRRLASLLLTLVLASAVVFSALEILPGDAAQVVLGTSATPPAVAALRAQLGLDRPALLRYSAWLAGLAQGHTAHSLSYGVATADLIAERLRVTLPLAVLALLLTVAMALTLGLQAATDHRTWRASALSVFSQLGMAVPGFWVAILLILLFAVQLQWVNAGGFPGWTEAEGGGPAQALRALLLPALALALVQGAILARVMRSAVLEVRNEDYVRTARAKGLSHSQTLRRHVLRNALLPVLTVAGLQFANLLTGTIVVENVFVLPGMGRLLFQAIANRDLVLVRDGVMVLAALVLLVSLVVDLLYALVDPRLRHR
jgi:peptide/nickel transport system permease protein